MHVSEKEFDRMVEAAIRRIPPEIGQHISNLVISVLNRPSAELLEEMDLRPGTELLGLFRGVPLIDRSVTSPPLYPDTIFLFQRSIEQVCPTMEELEEQIEVTIVHEVAHYVGMTEERLRELGYG
jgi:predicted Zn-dependent protease with MMP-like domain